MGGKEYTEALRRGEKSYHEALSKGAYPYLQVLDEILSHVSSPAKVNLGLVEIPSDAVKGTVTAGRKTAFAPNFMPLLGANSEFAYKWQRLCEAHLSEGIHDPVRAYEYMNHYYILEGNKRVSVLKYFDAPTIPAIVTRLIPKRSEETENVVYFEYLDFYKVCPVNFLIFTKPGSYKALQELAGKGPEELWTEDERKDLSAAYSRFSSALHLVPADRDGSVPDGDAFLTWLNLYGYKEALTKMPETIREELLKMQDELRLLKKDDRVRLVMDADSTPKKNMFGRLIDAVSDRKLKIAFIYNRKPDESAWTYAHELGRLYVSDLYGKEVETVAYENVTMTEIDGVLEKAIKDGADVIFSTTRFFMDACVKAAVAHPNVKILCCTLNAAHRYIRTYYARIYETKFLCGVIAGAMSKDGRIGYLSDYPIPMNLANINAFALGVSAVNPNAKVYLKWTAERTEDAAAFFKEQDIKLISGVEIAAPGAKQRSFGLYEVGEDGAPSGIAMTVYDWGTVYQKLIDSIRDGNWEDVDRRSEQRALNYWWGMDNDAVDLIISKRVPEETKKLATFLGNSIRNHSMNPFYGVIETQTGTVGEENRTFDPEQIMTMNWLYKNVVGHIPELKDLTPDAESLVTLQGRNVEFAPKKGVQNS